MSSSLCRSLLSAALVAAAACASGTEPQQGSNASPGVAATLPRALTAGEQKIIGASNKLSFSLFRQLNAAQRDSNIFASSLGASMALGMMMNGAAGPTYDQMRATLGLGAVSDAELATGYQSLLAILGDLDPVADVRVGSSLWYRSDVPVNQGFIDAGLSAYGAQVSALDFASPTSAQAINAWVSATTTGRIATIVDAVDASQSMVLANAIYFRGTWRDRFDPIATSNAAFNGAAGEQAAKVMYRVGLMRYFASHEFEAVDVPFGKGAFTMTVVLPRAGKTIDATVALFQGGGWANLGSQQRDVGMNLFLPRFRILWDRNLNDDLAALGMRDAFVRNSADFTRMSPRGRELYLGAVKQKTLIDVGEDGTISAPTTPVVPSTFGFVPLVMYVDRPFVFVIHERLSGTIVFMGKVVRM